MQKQIAPEASGQPKVTLKELLLWNQDQLRQLQEIAPHTDEQMEALRVNAIAVAQEQCQRNQSAIEHNNPDRLVEVWMMETFGSPQMVRVRNQAGEVVSVLTVLEILNAKPVPAQGE